MTLPYDYARCIGTDHTRCADCRRQEKGRDRWQPYMIPSEDPENCFYYIPTTTKEESYELSTTDRLRV